MSADCCADAEIPGIWGRHTVVRKITYIIVSYLRKNSHIYSFFVLTYQKIMVIWITVSVLRCIDNASKFAILFIILVILEVYDSATQVGSWIPHLKNTL